MKDAYYFSHDANARHDEKILELRAELGWEGYGLFWAIIECLREASGYKYSIKRLNGLALHLTTTKDKLEQVIFNFGLFELDEEFFWSESLLRRMEERDSKVRKAKESAQKRWEEYYAKQEQNDTNANANANANETDNNNNIVSSNNAVEDLSILYANAERTHSETYAIKGKESKGKERKEKEIYYSSPPKSNISEEGKDFANFFKQLLPPTQKVTDSDLKNWADTFDKLVRIDKRPRDEIYQVTEWARKDSFWGEQGNFLSACKLRNKSKDGVLYYDMFLQKFKQRSKSNGTSYGQQVQRPDWVKAKE